MSTKEARLKRIQDAIALQEPDRVPFIPINQTYPILNAGYTMAEVLYDYNKGADAFIKYAEQYQPDDIMGHAYMHMGMGPAFELMKLETVTWAGAPDHKIGENSIHQFIEFAVLHDDEMDFFRTNYSGWLFERGIPRISNLLGPMAHWGISTMGLRYDISNFAAAISAPESRQMIKTLWQIDDLVQGVNTQAAALEAKLEAMGFPMLYKGIVQVPYDLYTDWYRGTIEATYDLYDNEDIILQFSAKALAESLEFLSLQAQWWPGKFVFMPLHKGMDGFMSDDQYEKFYWKDLQTQINHIIDCGMTPYVYTEGPYTSRLEFLKEVPKGKVIYHFEECDMAKAKKVLGGTACISGGFPVYLLHFGTKQQVIDECKRLIDTCAPGGGFIFETSSGFDNAKPENVEAMVQTVKEYGKR